MDKPIDGVVQALIEVAVGKVQHLYRGTCPDAIEGFDSRDPQCPACRVLIAAQQQGQAVAECHCATCTCAPGMTPAVRFDTSPAAQEGAVRDHLIALGWTPPGAQQPAAEEQLTYKGVPIGPMQTFADMERQASAPAGVELSALRVQEWLHREHDILCPVQEIEQAMRTPCSCQFTERALAQQPAAPSGEAVGEWVLVPREPTDAMLRAAQSAWLNDTLRRTTTMWRAMLEAAPRRPAAVDGAKETDLWRCTVCGRVGTVGRCCGEETREPFRPNTQVQPCREAAAALAAQPGGAE